MKETLRLTYIDNINNDLINELWRNCFAGQENVMHMNAHVPYPLTEQWQLNSFITRANDYNVWVIKRREEKDIIGFIIHGNFFPGHPNNIGFNIGLNYTRNGFATEALKGLIQHLRLQGLKETFGHCFETNTGSIQTMLNCGFQNLGPTGAQYRGINELKFKINL